MTKKEIDQKFDQFWKQDPPEISYAQKEKGWNKFFDTSFHKLGLKKMKPALYAASIAILMILGAGFYRLSQPTQEVASLIHIENPGDQVKVIFLPDSSEVRLQPNSKISYAKNYGNNRGISLQGTAFFKVVKDKKHPFKVLSKKTTTTVLGTSFSVFENDIKTIVKLFEGEVKMNIRGQSKSWILSPGEEFTLQAGKPAITEFKTYLDFEKESIYTIIRFLEESYSFKIDLPQNIGRKKTTLRINKAENIEIPLKIISEIYNLSYKIDQTHRQAILKSKTTKHDNPK